MIVTPSLINHSAIIAFIPSFSHLNKFPLAILIFAHLHGIIFEPTFKAIFERRTGVFEDELD